MLHAKGKCQFIRNISLRALNKSLIKDVKVWKRKETRSDTIPTRLQVFLVLPNGFFNLKLTIFVDGNCHYLYFSEATNDD